jgi:aryl-alcohol dehydrogenase-like predicted oxidoreductase
VESRADSKNGLSRRSFLWGMGATATGLTTSAFPIRAFAQKSSATGRKAQVVGRRKLGSLEVSSVGLGCQDFTGTFYATAPNRSDMITLARTAHDDGVTLFDMAEAYGPLEVERILEEALGPIRNQVVIESKFGWNIDPDTGKNLGGLNSQPKHIRRSVDGMLKRLKTDRIDLLYQHRVDPNVPIEDVAGAVKDLIAQGKVLHFGLSEPGIETLRRAHAVQPLTAVQNEYSMMARDPETEVLPTCRELGIGFVCWSPLAMAFLTGDITESTPIQRGDFRGMVPWFAPENRPGNLKLVAVVKEWAVRKNATPAQIALAWLMAQQPWIVPIPGTTKTPHLLDNIGADGVRLTSEEAHELTAAIDRVPVQGARLPAGVLSLSGVEAPKKQS